MNRASKEKRQEIWKKGKRAENAAGIYLQSKGYHLLAGNVRLKTGEIDIIATRDNVLVIVEVKARQTLEEGLAALTTRQCKRIINATSEWLAIEYEKGQTQWQNFDIRYDVIVLTDTTSLPHHIEHAYEAY